MSVEATTWAWQQQTESSGQRLVLLALADAAGGDEDDPRVCWPSVARVARMVALNGSTVRKHIDGLERQGLIAKEERRRRANGTLGTWVYLVLFGGDQRSPTSAGGGPDQRSPMSGRPALTHERALTVSTEPPVEPSMSSRVASVAALFDEFWGAYPKQTSKGNARNRWGKLTKQDRLDAIAGAQRHRDHCARLPGVFVLPAADVWLNQRRWEDDEPKRNPKTTANNPYLDMIMEEQ